MTTTEGMQKLAQRQVRSPRSAALAGILFSLKTSSLPLFFLAVALFS